MYTPDAGICVLKAVAALGDHDAQFTELKDRLTDKYREPETENSNSLREQGILLLSVWEDPSLMKRNLNGVYLAKMRSHLLKSPTWRRIMLPGGDDEDANRDNDVLVSITYLFTNYDDCEAEAKAMRQDDGLQKAL